MSSRSKRRPTIEEMTKQMKISNFMDDMDNICRQRLIDEGLDNDISALTIAFQKGVLPTEVLLLFKDICRLFIEGNNFFIVSSQTELLDQVLKGIRKYIVNDEQYEYVRAFDHFSNLCRANKGHFLADINLENIANINTGELKHLSEDDE